MSAQLPAVLPPPVPAHLLALTGARFDPKASTPALRLHVPSARYHAEPALSISRLKLLQRSASHFLHGLTSGMPETRPMCLGKAAHCAVLEPERYDRDFAIWDRVSEAGNLCPRRGQYWEAFQAEHAHQTIINPDEHEHAMLMQNAIRSDPLAWRYLERGASEVSMRWAMHGRACRGRPDYVTAVDRYPYLVGIKTARDASPYAFGNAATRLGYHLQWAWYHDGFDHIQHTRPRVKEIVVESKPPYAVVVYDIPEDVIDFGRDEYLQLLARLEECERGNHWPGPGLDAEVTFALAAWAHKSSDDLTAIGLEF